MLFSVQIYSFFIKLHLIFNTLTINYKTHRYFIDNFLIINLNFILTYLLTIDGLSHAAHMQNICILYFSSFQTILNDFIFRAH